MQFLNESIIFRQHEDVISQTFKGAESLIVDFLVGLR